MITERMVTVPYLGDRDVVAPLAWGQQSTWVDIQHFLPEVKAFSVMGGWLEVPATLTVQHALHVLGAVIGRHESLRSRYRTGPDGRGEQQVLSHGSIEVPVLDRSADHGADVPSVGYQAALEILNTGFRHDTDGPFRPVLVLDAGRPALLLFGLSHVAADQAGADLLSAELSESLQAAAGGTSGPQPRAGWQPVDIARFEQSPHGQALNAQSSQYLRNQLLAAPPVMLEPDRHPPQSPRFWRGQLESAAVPPALRLVARRYRTSTSVVLLAVATALIGALDGALDRHASCTLGLVLANRRMPESQHCVTSLSQTVQATIDLTGPGMAELIAAAAVASEQAQQHGRYDLAAADAVTAEVAAERGLVFDLTCRFNDTWSSFRRQRSRHRPPPGEIEAAAGASTFSWLDRTDSDKISLFIDIFGTDEQVQLRALADTGRVPPAAIEALLRGYERLLIRLITDEPSLTEVAAMLRPAALGAV